MRRSLLTAAKAGSVTIQLTDTAQSGTGAEASYTYGERYAANQTFTVKKMSVLGRTSAIGTSLDVRFGIWNPNTFALLASTALTTITLARVNPTMVPLTAPLTLVSGTKYTFGLYLPAGQPGGNILGSAVLTASPSGYLTVDSNGMADSGFVCPSSLPIPYAPPILLST